MHYKSQIAGRVIGVSHLPVRGMWCVASPAFLLSLPLPAPFLLPSFSLTSSSAEVAMGGRWGEEGGEGGGGRVKKGGERAGRKLVEVLGSLDGEVV